MAGISGIGSGIDIDKIVGALVSAERAPKDAQLARLEKATTTKFSALGQFRGALGELQTAIGSLKDPTLFQKISATVADTSRLTATATQGAAAGTYAIQVKALATSSKVATASVSSASSATFNAGQLTVSLGGVAQGVVDIAQGAKLQDVATAINAKVAGKGISASVVTDPANGSGRLVLSSTKTGAGQGLTLEATSLTGSSPSPVKNLDSLNITAGIGALASSGAAAGFISQAANAQIEVDGIQINPPTNTVSDAIGGVTLNLLKAEVGVETKLTVGVDKGAATSAIKKFVESYNKLISTTNQLTSVVSAGDGKPPVVGGLVGDSSVRSVLSGLRAELVSPQSGGDINVLADLGITTQKDGTLKVDDAKLNKAIGDNFTAVSSFLTGSDGLMSRLASRVDGYTKSGGVLQQRMDGLQGTLRSVEKQKSALELRMTQVQDRLYAQFQAMDSLVSQLNKTSERLTQALGSLPGVVKKNS